MASSKDRQHNELVYSTDDNLKAAMKQVAETMPLTRPSNTNADGDATASKQVLIRATEYDRDRWKQAADKEDISLSEFIRNACNHAAAESLDCQHPIEMRKIYPWSETCLKCKTRLR